MIGLSDEVIFEKDIKLPKLDKSTISSIKWQTKSLSTPNRNIYKITEDSQLIKEVWHSEIVPKEERPKYDNEINGFRKKWHSAFGMRKKVTEGWKKIYYSGNIKIYGKYINLIYTYELTFNHGKLTNVKFIKKQKLSEHLKRKK